MPPTHCQRCFRCCHACYRDYDVAAAVLLAVRHALITLAMLRLSDTLYALCHYYFMLMLPPFYADTLRQLFDTLHAPPRATPACCHYTPLYHYTDVAPMFADTPLRRRFDAIRYYAADYYAAADY